MSLQSRATLLGTLGVTVLLVVGSLLLVSTLESRLTSASDQLSRSRVDDLLRLAATGDLPSTLRNVDENGLAQVVTGNGTVLASSPNIVGASPVADLRPGPTAATSTFRAPDDDETETYRVWYASGPSPEGSVTVYVGNSLEAVSEASGVLRTSLWFGVPAAVLLLATAIWLLLGHALGRLDRIRVEVDRITQDNLHARVSGDGVDDEVGRLAATMNAMLERLDSSAQRQREFVADVSHDLQSPLAALRVALEVALVDPTGIDTARFREDTLGATTDMERLVGDLLVLASMDAATTSSPTMIDLDVIILEEVARATTQAQVSLDSSGVSAAPAYANADDVRRVVRNLLDNAVAHARARVALTAQESAGVVQMLITDDGPGVPTEQHDRIFERFHRAETARSPGGGTGLGLSIARDLAERNHGQVDLLRTPHGAAFRLLLPTSADNTVTDRRRAGADSGWTQWAPGSIASPAANPRDP